MIATISELSIAVKKMLLKLFPLMAFTKLVRNVLESEVKYDLLGIHLNGMARICFASMNEEQNMKMIGTTVNIIRSARTI